MLLVVLPFTVSAGSVSSDQVAEWLKRLSYASKNLNYEGVFVYRHGDRLESVQIIHKADSKGEHERIVSLNGVAREVIRENDKVTCILPDSKDVVVSSKPSGARLPVFPSDIDGLAEHYDFVFEGHGRIAGRPVRQIAIRPKDKYRYGYRLWLDDAFELLLRSDLLDNEGNAVEQVMFTDIKLVESIDENRLLPNISGKEYNWVTGDDKHAKYDHADEGKGWNAVNVPAGFYLKHKNVHRMPENPRAVNHLLYSDGLASVSVYIEAYDDSADVLKGASRMGAVNAFGNVVGKHHVTAVGEVPRATVELISSSVQYQQGKAK
jgi:sigma-E factor negative regulatory protein RseB